MTFEPPPAATLASQPFRDIGRVIRAEFVATGTGLPPQRVFEPGQNAPVPDDGPYATAQIMMTDTVGTGRQSAPADSADNPISIAMRSTVQVNCYREQAMERALRLVTWLSGADARLVESEHDITFLRSGEVLDTDWLVAKKQQWEARATVDLEFSFAYTVTEQHPDIDSAEIEFWRDRDAPAPIAPEPTSSPDFRLVARRATTS